MVADVSPRLPWNNEEGILVVGGRRGLLCDGREFPLLTYAPLPWQRRVKPEVRAALIEG